MIQYPVTYWNISFLCFRFSLPSSILFKVLSSSLSTVPCAERWVHFSCFHKYTILWNLLVFNSFYHCVTWLHLLVLFPSIYVGFIQLNFQVSLRPWLNSSGSDMGGISMVLCPVLRCFLLIMQHDSALLSDWSKLGLRSLPRCCME